MDFGIIKDISVDTVLKDLQITKSTYNRWRDLKKIPQSYELPLNKLLGYEIDYSLLSIKQKDQFFTPEHLVDLCYEIFTKFVLKNKIRISEYIFIEPSAGSGSFLKVLPRDKTIAIDIEPRDDAVLKSDYLDWHPKEIADKYIVFGNPPFGLRGNTALKFINHSYIFADYVCFILPPLFESDGRGTPKNRVNNGYILVHSEKLPLSFYNTPENKNIPINTIFQVWTKNRGIPEIKIENRINNDSIKIFSLSDGGSSATTRNKKMLYSCDVYLPSTCYGKDKMKVYDSFEELPNRRGYGICLKDKNIVEKILKIDWCSVCVSSTNSSLNLKKSDIYNKINEIKP